MRCNRCDGRGKLRAHDPDSDGAAELYPDCERCGGTGYDMRFHPVQVENFGRHPTMPREVVMRGYEVYCELHGPQEAMVTGFCRGGFGIGELAAFLYARSFPKPEWAERVKEALRRSE